MTLDSSSTPVGHFAGGAYAAGSQTAIPCLLMRGGTSRGPFFSATDLPADPALRDRVLLAVMGSPHRLQVDGVGGGHPLTSKVGIVARSTEEGIDLDFTFAQLQPDKTTVQMTANCGNMLAAVVPFALESGLLTPTADTTTAMVKTLNTGLIAQITVSTPVIDGHRVVSYAGDAAIAGVAGSSAPVSIRFLDTAGSVAPALFPTGNHQDTIIVDDGRELTVTMIDNGQPMVVIQAHDINRSGYETPDELNADDDLKQLLEDLRLKAGKLMGLGDVTDKSYPKMTLVAPAQHGGVIATRSFIPHKVHESIGVLAAITVATATCVEGTVASELADVGVGTERRLAVEHPSGSFEVDIELDTDGNVVRSGNTRTARLLMAGHIFIPRTIWDPSRPSGAANQPNNRIPEESLA